MFSSVSLGFHKWPLMGLVFVLALVIPLLEVLYRFFDHATSEATADDAH